MYVKCHAWFVSTHPWLVHINQQSPKTGDSQNRKGISVKPDPLGEGAQIDKCPVKK